MNNLFSEATNIDELLQFSAGSLPETLWHYTSTSAFLNIIKNGCLWFTDYRVLNDSSEFNFGIEVFLNRLTSMLKDEKNTKRRELLHRLEEEFERSRKWIRAYVFCMTPQNDSLTHWRGYPGNNEPLAIGLNFYSLQLAPWQGYRSQLVAVIYDGNIQSHLAERAVEIFLALPQSLAFVSSNDSNLDSMSFDGFILNCCDLCVRFKKASFSDEREWRLITRFGLEHGPLSDLKFRSKGNGISPYLEMRTGNGMLPINCLTIGPPASKIIQVEAHGEFLRRHEYFDVEVRASDIPIN